MKITLDVSRFCIETASKRKYENLIKHCFKFQENGFSLERIERQITGLKFFLENADFQDLLSRIKPARCGNQAVLCIPEDPEKTRILFNGSQIIPQWKR